MARLNIEDSIYIDPRFFRLSMALGSREAALGSLILAWSLGQKFYLKEETDRKIPHHEWIKLEIKNEILAEKFATLKDGFIEIDGADANFGWLLQKQKAGQKSGESRRTAVNKRSTHVNSREPLSLSLPLPPDELLNSSASAAEKNEFKSVVNNSATSNFDARFAPDAEKWDTVLDEFGIRKRLNRHIGAIRNSFDSPEGLRDFINLKAESDTCKAIVKESAGDLEKARPRVEQFVLVCLKREIGVIQ